MRIALLAPLPPERNGIAGYASHFRAALEQNAVEVVTPLAGATSHAVIERLTGFDWSSVDLAHAELGGGRLEEFNALVHLRRRQPNLPLTATVHDPERLVWRRASFPWPLSQVRRLPSPFPQAATVLCDPLTLYEERRLAAGLAQVFTLTQLGGQCLAQRMRLTSCQWQAIAHGNLDIPPQSPPPLDTLRLLYFGFIYRGKGIEDLIQALSRMLVANPSLRSRISLTLAGGTAPETAFDSHGNYLKQLRTQISNLGLDDVVHWQLDLPEADIPGLIQAHHVMVLPYRESKKLNLLGVQRGTSGALSWAAACGRGAITSDARAFAEEVAAGNGAIYPQGNVDALAQRLADLANNPRQALQWAERAAEIGRARSWTETARRFKEAFSSVLAESRT